MIAILLNIRVRIEGHNLLTAGENVEALIQNDQRLFSLSVIVLLPKLPVYCQCLYSVIIDSSSASRNHHSFAEATLESSSPSRDVLTKESQGPPREEV